MSLSREFAQSDIVQDLFATAPWFRGGRVIPKERVFRADHENLFSSSFVVETRYDGSDHDYPKNLRKGDAVIFTPVSERVSQVKKYSDEYNKWGWLKRDRITVVPGGRFDDLYEPDPFHDGQYRSRLTAQAIFLDEDLLAQHPEIAQVGRATAGRFLVKYENGLFYNKEDREEAEVKNDKSGMIECVNHDRLASYFGRSDETGKTVIPMTLSLDEQLQRARKHGWVDHIDQIMRAALRQPTEDCILMAYAMRRTGLAFISGWLNSREPYEMTRTP